MTTFCNKANANANDCKEEAVICKKNRLYDLPSELENYIYSFVENSLHEVAHKKLYLDKTFIKLMWKNFDVNDYWKDIVSNYDEEELEIEEGIMEMTRAKFRYFKDILPSHISIDYYDEANYTVKVVGQDDLRIIHYTDEEVEEKVGEYLEDDEHLLYLCPHLLYINFKNSSYDLGIEKEDIVKLQEDENYNLIKKLVDLDEVKDSIINDGQTLEDLADSIFCSDYTYTRLSNGVLALDEY
jgi:hypothetical protein